jgi:hypothetical protein
MKKIIVLIFFVFIKNLNAQVPQGIPYQAVARNGQGQPLANMNVKVRFSILDSTASGTAVYVETHSATTSALGLFTANVGMGTASTGTFSAINWGQNYKFLKVELDTTATGNSYIDLGTQQMMSVPYALYAGSGLTGQQGPVGPQGANGLSAYEVWLAQGNTGSASDFLASLNNSNLNNVHSYSYNGPPQIVGHLGDFAINLTNGFLYYWNSVTWSLINSTCPTPTTSIAGQSYNALNNEIVNLNANVPIIGTGHWDIIQGAGGSFSNANLPTSQFQGIPNESYVLQWTISTLCNSSTSNININFQASKTFNNSQIFTIPIGVNHVKFELYGGGGGGEPVSGCGECYYCHWYLRNGGGAGSYGSFEISGNIANSSFNLVVGAGGSPGQNGGSSQIGTYFAGGGLAGNNGGDGGISNCPINQTGFHGLGASSGNGCFGNPNNGISGINGLGSGGHGGFFQRQGSGDVIINGSGSDGAIIITSL